MNTRNTIQRMLILDAVKTLDCHPTADDVYAEVARKCPNVSRGTVYRNLGRLADEGAILRVAVANAPDRFDHTCHNHRHFRCTKCGKVTDFGNTAPIEIADAEKNGCRIEGCDIMYYGECAECADT